MEPIVDNLYVYASLTDIAGLFLIVFALPFAISFSFFLKKPYSKYRKLLAIFVMIIAFGGLYLCGATYINTIKTDKNVVEIRASLFFDSFDLNNGCSFYTFKDENFWNLVKYRRLGTSLGKFHGGYYTLKNGKNIFLLITHSGDINLYEVGDQYFALNHENSYLFPKCVHSQLILPY